MNSKSLLWLSIIVVLVSGAAYLSVRANKAASPVAAEQGPLAPALAARADDITTITITRGGTSATLTRTGPADWVLADKGHFPVEKEKPRALLRALAQASIVEPKTSDPALYERLGVADPAPANASMLVRVADAKGEPILALIVGNTKNEAAFEAGQPRPGRYVRREGQPQSFLALMSIDAEADPIAWINRTVADMPVDQVESLTVTRPEAAGGGVVRFWRERPEDQNFLAAPIPEGRQIKEEGFARRCAAALSFIAMDDVRPAAEIESHLGEAILSEFRRFDGVVVRVRTMTLDERGWSTFEAAYEPSMPEPALQPGGAAEIPPEGDAASTPGDPKKEEESTAEAKAEVQRLNERWKGWAYALPAFKLEQIIPSQESILAPATAPGAAGPTLPE